MCQAPDSSLVIRPARAADRLGLVRLAQLDSAVPVFDVDLVAEVDGRLVAAVTADGAALADPFEHTAALLGFMRTETDRRLLARGAGLAARTRAARTYPRSRRSRRYWRTNPATNAGL